MKKQKWVITQLVSGTFAIGLLFVVSQSMPLLQGQGKIDNSNPSSTVFPAAASERVVAEPMALPPLPDVPLLVLYDQYNCPADFATTSQDFETAFDQYDDQAADDFIVPPGQTWNVTGVDAQGFSNGGSVASFHVYFYQDSGTLPGPAVHTALGQSYTTSGGNFMISLSPAAVLPAGTYWVSVQARLDTGGNGDQWFWQNRTVQSNNGAAWQNPPNGFATGCTTWNRRTTCITGNTGPDQVYRLIGSRVGCSRMSSFMETFDAVTAPALPAGWTAANVVGPAPMWVTSSSGVPTPVADTPPNAAYVDDPNTISDKRLTTPDIFVAGNSAQLTFRQNFDLEEQDTNIAYDAGVLEISINGGAFSDIITAGGTFAAGGYNHTSISTCCANPLLPSRPNWSGNSGGFITTTVNLPAAAAGGYIALRWRMGSDSTVSREGWRVDTISTIDCVCPLRVLIAYADSPQPDALRSEILAETGVVVVDFFNAHDGTPSLCQLKGYDVVVPYSNIAFADATALGDRLADYVDGGGIVVQYGLSHFGPNQPYGINGRWVTGNYNPYGYSTNLVFGVPFTLGTFNSGHPLMSGVSTLNSDYQDVVTPATGAIQVAAASNGNSLIAYRPVSGGHTTVGVTAYVGFSAAQSGPWGRVVVNAARWLLPNCKPGVVGAVSRKMHGGAGTFDVDLPLIGTSGIECRSGGGTNDYTIAVTFANSVAVNGSPQAQVTSGAATIGSGGVPNGGVVTVSGNTVTIPLTNVADAQTIYVRLNSVTDGSVTSNVTIPMSRLLGDTNGNGAVNAGDVAQTKSRIGQAIATANFRSDFNESGGINAGDVAIAKSNTGQGLP